MDGREPDLTQDLGSGKAVAGKRKKISELNQAQGCALCAPGWSFSTFSSFLSEDYFGDTALIFPNVASCLCRGQSL